MKTENEASLNPAALAHALRELKEATADLEYAISRIAASKDKTLGEGTAAFRIKRAGECRDAAADRAEEVVRVLTRLRYLAD